jgi:membrane fusion protein (multidrug efflux system)
MSDRLVIAPAAPLLRPVLVVSSLLAALGLAVGLSGCEPAQSQAPGGAAGPTVGVITVTRTPVAIQTELPGRLEAWRTAQVRARVSGIVQKRLYTEGTQVSEGASLYRL